MALFLFEQDRWIFVNFFHLDMYRVVFNYRKFYGAILINDKPSIKLSTIEKQMLASHTHYP